jgi:hypothetical protein
MVKRKKNAKGRPNPVKKNIEEEAPEIVLKDETVDPEALNNSKLINRGKKTGLNDAEEQTPTADALPEDHLVVQEQPLPLDNDNTISPYLPDLSLLDKGFTPHSVYNIKEAEVPADNSNKQKHKDKGDNENNNDNYNIISLSPPAPAPEPNHPPLPSPVIETIPVPLTDPFLSLLKMLEEEDEIIETSLLPDEMPICSAKTATNTNNNNTTAAFLSVDWIKAALYKADTKETKRILTVRATIRQTAQLLAYQSLQCAITYLQHTIEELSLGSLEDLLQQMKDKDTAIDHPKQDILCRLAGEVLLSDHDDDNNNNQKKEKKEDRGMLVLIVAPTRACCAVLKKTLETKAGIKVHGILSESSVTGMKREEISYAIQQQLMEGGGGCILITESLLSTKDSTSQQQQQLLLTVELFDLIVVYRHNTPPTALEGFVNNGSVSIKNHCRCRCIVLQSTNHPSLSQSTIPPRIDPLLAADIIVAAAAADDDEWADVGIALASTNNNDNNNNNNNIVDDGTPIESKDQPEVSPKIEWPVVISGNASCRPIRARRPLYEQILELEKHGVTVVERPLSLVDAVLSPSLALVIHSAQWTFDNGSGNDSGGGGQVDAAAAAEEWLVKAEFTIERLSYAFSRLIMVVEGSPVFLSEVSGKGVDAFLLGVAFKCGVHLQLLTSHSSQQTAELVTAVMTGVRDWWNSLPAALQYVVVEDPGETESFLESFYSLNSHSAAAMGGSGYTLQQLLNLDMGSRSKISKDGKDGSNGGSGVSQYPGPMGLVPRNCLQLFLKTAAWHATDCWKEDDEDGAGRCVGGNMLPSPIIIDLIDHHIEQQQQQQFGIQHDLTPVVCGKNEDVQVGEKLVVQQQQQQYNEEEEEELMVGDQALPSDIVYHQEHSKVELLQQYNQPSGSILNNNPHNQPPQLVEEDDHWFWDDGDQKEYGAAVGVDVDALAIAEAAMEEEGMIWNGVEPATTSAHQYHSHLDHYDNHQWQYQHQHQEEEEERKEEEPMVAIRAAAAAARNHHHAFPLLNAPPSASSTFFKPFKSNISSSISNNRAHLNNNEYISPPAPSPFNHHHHQEQQFQGFQGGNTEYTPPLPPPPSPPHHTFPGFNTNHRMFTQQPFERKQQQQQQQPFPPFIANQYGGDYQPNHEYNRYKEQQQQQQQQHNYYYNCNVENNNEEDEYPMDPPPLPGPLGPPTHHCNAFPPTHLYRHQHHQSPSQYNIHPTSSTPYSAHAPAFPLPPALLYPPPSLLGHGQPDQHQQRQQQHGLYDTHTNTINNSKYGMYGSREGNVNDVTRRELRGGDGGVQLMQNIDSYFADATRAAHYDHHRDVLPPLPSHGQGVRMRGPKAGAGQVVRRRPPGSGGGGGGRGGGGDIIMKGHHYRHQKQHHGGSSYKQHETRGGGVSKKHVQKKAVGNKRRKYTTKTNSSL